MRGVQRGWCVSVWVLLRRFLVRWGWYGRLLRCLLVIRKLRSGQVLRCRGMRWVDELGRQLQRLQWNVSGRSVERLPEMFRGRYHVKWNHREEQRRLKLHNCD